MRLPLALAAVLAVALSGCGAPAQPPAKEHITVHMTDQDSFDPNVLTVAVGSTVTWLNVAPTQPSGFDCRTAADANPYCHDVDVWLGSDLEVKSSYNQSRHTSLLSPGESWSYTFTQPGDYEVFCHVHHDPQRMIMEVHVR